MRESTHFFAINHNIRGSLPSTTTADKKHATDMIGESDLCRCINSIGDARVDVNKAGRAPSLERTTESET
jgi:hypothetical protein